MTALQNCTSPSSKYGITANLQSQAPRFAQLHVAQRSGSWHGGDNAGPNAASTNYYTPVVGDIWAQPLLVTSGVRRVTGWSADLSAVSTGGTTVWFAIYDDRAWSGYPQVKYNDTTPSTAVALPATATVFNSAGAGSGSISQPLDPGLYWKVLQIATINVPGALRTVKGPSLSMPGLATGGGQFAASSSPCAYKLTGQPAGPLPKTFPLAATLFDNAPLIGVLLV
jgi:hypothetical protein